MIRLKTFLATLVALVAILALPSISAAAPGPACVAGGTPPSDINTYLVLAKKHFQTKGGNTPTTGNFLGGNVGVSDDDGTLQVGANGSFRMSDNTALVADGTIIDPTVIGDDEVKVWDVFTNNTTSAILDPSVTWHNSPNPYCINSFPVVNNFPADPVFTPGTSPADDRTINGAETLQPEPTKYGNVVVKGTLTLGPGTFNFLSLKLDGGVINTDPGTVINIAQDAIGDGQWGSSDLTRWFVRGDGVNAADNVVNFSVSSSVVHGTWIVPNGEIALGHGTNITGRIWGNSMHSDFNINMTYAAPESISGEKFEDTNGNGQKDQGEPPLAGFTFYVDVNDNGQFDPNEPSADSDATGNWSIGPIYLTGTYNVREVGKSGYTCKFPAGNCSYSLDLGAAGVDHGGNDFGNQPSVPCTPGPGQNPDCTPVVVNCVPTAGQDQNCNTIPVAPPVKPKTIDSAKVSGLKGGCTTTSNVRVSGSNIKKVTYKIDGKTVKTVKKGPFTYKLKTKNYKVGAHKLKVTTTFKSGKTKTQTLTFQHCRQVQPHFTG